MSARLHTVVINSEQPDRLVGFWSVVLGVEVRSDEPSAGITWLHPDRPGGVAVAIQRVAHKLARHTETHLDIGIDDLDEAQAIVERAGGALVEIHHAGDFEWRVMADPDGNEFCLFVDAH